MEHDTKKLNSFLDCIARCPEGMSYHAMLNLWMEESGSSLSDTEELEFYIKLIPMVFKRRRRIMQCSQITGVNLVRYQTHASPGNYTDAEDILR